MTALAPEHLADLQRSGLSADTIHALRFEAVRPSELKVQGAESGYRIPYFKLDGQRNCFDRVRLFPVIKRRDGSSQKYHQKAGTVPQLYLLPLFNWLAVAKNSGCDVHIVEGEKKAAAACERGLFAAGVAGVWNWRQKLDSGEGLVIPAIDQFVWKGRTVELIPDSDAWREEKHLAVLSGFYALGQELISRGAVVRLTKLPERSGVKVGLDDFLVASSYEFETLWPALERLTLDDERLAPMAAWWQKWREKIATLQAVQTRDGEELELQEVAGLYTLRSAKHAVVFMLDRLEERHGGVHAELTVTLGAAEILDTISLNLKSDQAQARQANSLKSYSTAIPWKVLLQKVCPMVLRRHRQGEPLVRLDGQSAAEPLTFAINPLVPRKKPSILFADGGKGKSTFALMLSMAVSTGNSIAGLSALKGTALYLDWEDDKDVHIRRRHTICAGHPELGDAYVWYERCVESLTKLTHDLVRKIQREGITFVIVDSLLMAMGGDSSAEAVTKFFSALRMLNVESLCIGHVPKTIGEGQDQATVYGSVFNQNLARNLWELRTEQEVGEDSAILGLVHRKTNLTRKHAPIGLKVIHNEPGTYVRYEPYDLSQSAGLSKSLPAAAQIRNLLESDGVPRVAKDIAEEIGLPLTTVKSTLSREQGRKWQKLAGDDYRNQKWTVLGGGK